MSRRRDGLRNGDPIYEMPLGVEAHFVAPWSDDDHDIMDPAVAVANRYMDGMNHYAYQAGCPLSGFDPSGLMLAGSTGAAARYAQWVSDCNTRKIFACAGVCDVEGGRQIDCSDCRVNFSKRTGCPQ